ncbi:uncharacterized protein LOC125226415 [Leguminivora glycinivorella]|uniref:uncharacterized protein LOC125226415 n=1 Tax=Leguminivora glycinivorella TaxID=1035111 RepID=UPI00200EDCB2|nr:uncharacterized protein LOC125226415 [Leguminivora glycinivorella]
MDCLNVAEWSPTQVEGWLKGLGAPVGGYAATLRARGLDGAKLLMLRCDDLEYLGMRTIGHQELLLEAVEQLRNFVSVCVSVKLRGARGGLDGAKLLMLRCDDLEHLGMRTIGHQELLLEAVEQLRNFVSVCVSVKLRGARGGLDGAKLLMLRCDDLEHLGMRTIGHQELLLEAVEQLRNFVSVCVSVKLRGARGGLDGAKLLMLRCDDLEHLGMRTIGHQELLLEAVEQLRNFVSVCVSVKLRGARGGLDGAKLLMLRCDDLEYLGMRTIGHQELLLEAVEQLRNFVSVCVSVKLRGARGGLDGAKLLMLRCDDLEHLGMRTIGHQELLLEAVEQLRNFVSVCVSVKLRGARGGLDGAKLLMLRCDDLEHLGMRTIGHQELLLEAVEQLRNFVSVCVSVKLRGARGGLDGAKLLMLRCDDLEHLGMRTIGHQELLLEAVEQLRNFVSVCVSVKLRGARGGLDGAKLLMLRCDDLEHLGMRTIGHQELLLEAVEQLRNFVSVCVSVKLRGARGGLDGAKLLMLRCDDLEHLGMRTIGHQELLLEAVEQLRNFVSVCVSVKLRGARGGLDGAKLLMLRCDDLEHLGMRTIGHQELLLEAVEQLRNFVSVCVSVKLRGARGGLDGAKLLMLRCDDLEHLGMRTIGHQELLLEAVEQLRNFVSVCVSVKLRGARGGLDGAKLLMLRCDDLEHLGMRTIGHQELLLEAVEQLRNFVSVCVSVKLRGARGGLDGAKLLMLRCDDLEHLGMRTIGHQELLLEAVEQLRNFVSVCVSVKLRGARGGLDGAKLLMLRCDDLEHLGMRTIGHQELLLEAVEQLRNFVSVCVSVKLRGARGGLDGAKLLMLRCDDLEHLGMRTIGHQELLLEAVEQLRNFVSVCVSVKLRGARGGLDGAKLLMLRCDDLEHLGMRTIGHQELLLEAVEQLRNFVSVCVSVKLRGARGGLDGAKLLMLRCDDLEHLGMRTIGHQELLLEAVEQLRNFVSVCVSVKLRGARGGLDGAKLLMLRCDDLEHLGMRTIGHQELLLEAVEQLRNFVSVCVSVKLRGARGGLDGAKLLMLRCDDLEHLGMRTIGHQELLLEAVEQLRNFVSVCVSVKLRGARGGLDGAKLLMLRCDDLEHLGMRTIGHQELLLEAVEQLRNFVSVCVSVKLRGARGGLDGAKLLMLRCDDLEHLGMRTIGHQELLLEAVEQLRNFQYETSRECVQQMALRVSVAATGLARALAGGCERLETQTLMDVARAVAAVKALVCWLARFPLSGGLLRDRAAHLLGLCLEAATCAQRDRFAEQPARTVASAAAAAAASADTIVQHVSDSFVLAPATLETVSLRQAGKPLGFSVLPSLSGHLQLANIRFGSPAHASGAVHEGDEIVQVGGQCVVGWSGSAVESACAERAKGGGELLLRLRRRGARVCVQTRRDRYVCVCVLERSAVENACAERAKGGGELLLRLRRRGARVCVQTRRDRYVCVCVCWSGLPWRTRARSERRAAGNYCCDYGGEAHVCACRRAGTGACVCVCVGAVCRGERVRGASEGRRGTTAATTEERRTCVRADAPGQVRVCVCVLERSAVESACAERAKGGGELLLRLRRRGARVCVQTRRDRKAGRLEPEGTLAPPAPAPAAGDSDDDEPASPTLPLDRRMYPPPPRTLTARRHSVSGGSPTARRPRRGLDQLWCSLQQARVDLHYRRDKAVSCSTGLELSPRPRTCPAGPAPVPGPGPGPAPEPAREPARRDERPRGKLDKSHSTPAYDFHTEPPGPLTQQVIPESPTTPADSPTVFVHSAEKADQILDFKKSSSQIEEAILQKRRLTDEKNEFSFGESEPPELVEAVNVNVEAQGRVRRLSAKSPQEERSLSVSEAVRNIQESLARVAPPAPAPAPAYPALRAVPPPPAPTSPPRPHKIDVSQISVPLRHLTKHDLRVPPADAPAEPPAQGSPQPPAQGSAQGSPQAPARGSPHAPAQGSPHASPQGPGLPGPRPEASAHTNAPTRGIFPTYKSKSLKKKNSLLANTFPTLDQFKEFLTSRYRALEFIEPRNVNKVTSAYEKPSSSAIKQNVFHIASASVIAYTFPTLDQFKEFLTSRYRALEFIEPRNVNKVTSAYEKPSSSAIKQNVFHIASASVIAFHVIFS